MLAGSTHPADQRPVIRELIIEIEAVRQQRQALWRAGNHPEGKRFSQEELRDMACPSYKHLLLGTTQRLPARALILVIADYLECTLHETNDLLLAAQYLPMVNELREDEQHVVLDRAMMLLHTLPLPAAIVAKGTYIVAGNAAYKAINELSALETIPTAQRTAVHMCFDPSIFTSRLYRGGHQHQGASVRNTVKYIENIHQHFRHEPWYKQLKQTLHAFPEVRQHYGSNTVPVHDEPLPASVSLVYVAEFEPPIWEHNFAIPLGPTPFPFIHVNMPANDTAHALYSQRGYRVSGNRWEHALTLGESVR